MKCPDTGALQAFIDCELEIDARKDIEAHIAACKKCCDEVMSLKATDDFAFSKIKAYKQHFEDFPMHCPIPPSLEPNEYHKSLSLKGVLKNMQKYKKIVAAACAAVVLATSIAVPPVRSAIASTLSIFRVENVKGINISLTDLQEIQKKIAANQSEIDMEKLGKISVKGGDRSTITIEEAKKLQGLQVQFPADYSSVKPSISLTEASSIDFTLNVDNINQALKMFQSKKLFPKAVDGKTIRASFPPMVTLNYNNDKNSFSINQVKSPEITVPEGVNVDEIYEILVDLPLLPQNLQKQLKGIKDWKNTVYIPVVEDKMQEIDINGSKGYIASDYNSFNQRTYTTLIWYNKEVILTINGNISKEQTIDIAKSMR